MKKKIKINQTTSIQVQASNEDLIRLLAEQAKSMAEALVRIAEKQLATARILERIIMAEERSYRHQVADQLIEQALGNLLP